MIDNYISGWEALNIPNEQGLIADWHKLQYLSNVDNFTLYPYNEILKDDGVKRRFIPLLKNEFSVASFSRAIADLVYHKNTTQLKNCVYDFLDDSEEKELYAYLKTLYNATHREDIKQFMKYELTKLFFKDSDNA